MFLFGGEKTPNFGHVSMPMYADTCVSAHQNYHYWYCCCYHHCNCHIEPLRQQKKFNEIVKNREKREKETLFVLILQFSFHKMFRRHGRISSIDVASNNIFVIHIFISTHVLCVKKENKAKTKPNTKKFFIVFFSLCW